MMEVTKLVYSLLLLGGYAVMVNTQVCSDMQEMNCSEAGEFSRCKFQSSHVHYDLTLAVSENAEHNRRSLRHAAEENCYFITCSGAPPFSNNRPTVQCSMVEYTCSSPPETTMCQECPTDIARGVAIGFAVLLGFALLCAVVVIIVLVLLVKELQKQSAIQSGLPNPCGSVLRSLHKLHSRYRYCVEDHCSCLVSHVATESQPSCHRDTNIRSQPTFVVYKKPQKPQIGPKPGKEVSHPVRYVREPLSFSSNQHEKNEDYEDVS